MGDMGTTLFCYEIWLDVVFVVKGADLKEVMKLIGT